jgi:hypothetical protein
MTTNQIILDDGQFYIELNTNFESACAPGFLHHRCVQSPTNPGGHECVGSFQKSTAEYWSADIQSAYNVETDSDCNVVAMKATRLDAIAALWTARKFAYLAHQ